MSDGALPLCECGCGNRVKRPGARFLPGHWARTPGAKPRLGKNRTRRICPIDKQEFEVTNSRARVGGRMCSVRCRAIAQQKIPRPLDLNPLQQRCADYLRPPDGHLLRELAVAVGVKREALSQWIRGGKKVTTSTRHIAAIGAFFGLSYEEAKAEAGGVTTEERRSANGHKQMPRKDQDEEEQAIWRKGITPELQAKRNRGRRQSPETRAAIQAAHRCLEDKHGQETRVAKAQRKNAKWLDAYRNSDPGRLTFSLTTRLYHHRRRHGASPTAVQIREWAEMVASQRSLERSAVEASWRPQLMGLGLPLPHGGGPKLLEMRHQLVEEYIASRGLLDARRLPRGFWDDAASYVCQHDPADQIDGPALQTWWRHHLRSCRSRYTPST